MSWAWVGQAHPDKKINKLTKKIVRHAALRFVQFLKRGVLEQLPSHELRFLCKFLF
jgi:hypothetical protein